METVLGRLVPVTASHRAGITRFTTILMTTGLPVFIEVLRTGPDIISCGGKGIDRAGIKTGFVCTVIAG